MPGERKAAGVLLTEPSPVSAAGAPAVQLRGWGYLDGRTVALDSVSSRCLVLVLVIVVDFHQAVLDVSNLQVLVLLEAEACGLDSQRLNDQLNLVATHDISLDNSSVHQVLQRLVVGRISREKCHFNDCRATKETFRVSGADIQLKGATVGASSCGHVHLNASLDWTVSRVVVVLHLE